MLIFTELFPAVPLFALQTILKINGAAQNPVTQNSCNIFYT